MKPVFAAAAVSVAGIVSANDPAPRSDVEARLKALEVINAARRRSRRRMTTCRMPSSTSCKRRRRPKHKPHHNKASSLGTDGCFGRDLRTGPLCSSSATGTTRHASDGPGRIAELGASCALAGLRKPLLVTDKILAGMPMIGESLAALAKAGMPATLFSDVQGNPVENGRPRSPSRRCGRV